MSRGGAYWRSVMIRSVLNLKSARGAKLRENGKSTPIPVIIYLHPFQSVLNYLITYVSMLFDIYGICPCHIPFNKENHSAKLLNLRRFDSYMPPYVIQDLYISYQASVIIQRLVLNHSFLVP